MLPQEAKWFAQRFAELGDADISPMLNIGSQTEEFRTRDQPWIDRVLFAPLRARGHIVKHLDIQPAPGVDIVGDLADPAFRAELARMRFRSAMCCNLLEHVVNREEVARLVTAIVPPGGYIFVSVPYRFPYPPDPIDTLFRPTAEELAALFPGTRVHCQAIVNCGNLLTYLLMRVVYSPGRLLRAVIRRGRRAGAKRSTAPATHPAPAGAAANGRTAAGLFRRFQTTCLVLQKLAEQ